MTDKRFKADSGGMGFFKPTKGKIILAIILLPLFFIVANIFIFDNDLTSDLLFNLIAAYPVSCLVFPLVKSGFFKPTKGKTGVLLFLLVANFLLFDLIDPSLFETIPIANILTVPGLFVLFQVYDLDPSRQHYSQGWGDYSSISAFFISFLANHSILESLYYTFCNFPFLYLLSCSIVFLVTKLKKENTHQKT